MSKYVSMVSLLSSTFVKFERALIKERQPEGKELIEHRGVYKCGTNSYFKTKDNQEKIWLQEFLTNILKFKGREEIMETLNAIYNKDFYAWTVEATKLLRQRKFDKVDIHRVADIIEKAGNNEKEEVLSRLSLLMAYLLKELIKFKDDSITHIKSLRKELLAFLEGSPSLKLKLQEKFGEAYEKAVIIVAEELGVINYDFPKYCPFSLEDCLDEEFFPI